MRATGASPWLSTHIVPPQLDTSQGSILLLATLHLLRSNLFCILVAAIIFAGYGAALSGACDDLKPTAVSESQKDAGDHSCQCLCHQIFVQERIKSPGVVGGLEEAGLVFPELADIPPDAIPFGIDHPPQLA